MDEEIKIGDTVEVWDGRPKRRDATVIKAKVTAVHSGGLVDVVAVRPFTLQEIKVIDDVPQFVDSTKVGDRKGDEYSLTNLVPADNGPFRPGQFAVIKPTKPGVPVDPVPKPPGS